MKFMITWEVHKDKRQQALGVFSQMTTQQDEELMGSEVKLIGRWHDLVTRKGVCILESDNAAAVSSYAMKWNTAMDFNLGIVVDDEEAKELGRAEMESLDAESA